MKQYVLGSRIAHTLYAVVGPAFLIVAGTLWIYASAARPEQNMPWWFGALWLGWVFFNLPAMVNMPFRIEVLENGQIHFVGLLRRTTVWPQEIISVKQRSLGPGFVDVKHTRGKITLLQQFTNFHEFLSELRRMNPNVKVVGC